ncbi:hypothetical protein B0H67DRAFT_197517 [Lasiosphaeris hirsuta]|uniref:Uncharacterized protein n=1 Tax=Lasiosphaeris hirsuta TaxID=260670 RepID=A0AA40ARF8_9PEZI|nr:hypothetical protein B0H67DRAFT_197517 [Lasiosphaeris hirsuta]
MPVVVFSMFLKVPEPQTREGAITAPLGVQAAGNQSPVSTARVASSPTSPMDSGCCTSIGNCYRWNHVAKDATPGQLAAPCGVAPSYPSPPYHPCHSETSVYFWNGPCRASKLRRQCWDEFGLAIWLSVWARCGWVCLDHDFDRGASPQRDYPPLGPFSAESPGGSRHLGECYPPPDAPHSTPFQRRFGAYHRVPLIPFVDTLHVIPFCDGFILGPCPH